MRWIKPLLAGALVLALLWAVLGYTGTLPRIGPKQRAALALLREPLPALPGRNAHVAAYLISRGVPVAEWASYETLPAAQAVAALSKRPIGPDPIRAAFAGCLGSALECLAQVRANPDAARAVRESLTERLVQIERLERDYAHLATVEEPTLHTPFPPLGPLLPPVRLDTALRFVEGDAVGALDRLCAHAAYWRSLRQRTDILVADRLGAHALIGASETYAAMLAELPSGFAPPPACAAALAPLADAEFDQCRVHRTQFRISENTFRDVGEPKGDDDTLPRRFARRVAYDAEHTSAMVAPVFAAACETAQRERVAQRAPMPPMHYDDCDWEGRVFNAMGCLLAGISAPAHNIPEEYARVLDLDGRLTLVASAAWLHAQDRDPFEAFAQRPESLRDARHGLEGTACAPRLHFDPRVPRPNETRWELPLAPSPSCAKSASP